MEKIEVFEVLKPQGIKGELKLRNLTEDISLLREVSVFYINNDEYTLESIRENNGFAFIKFREINSVIEAEKLRGKFVLVDKEKMAEQLSEGEYFLSDLIGKDIFFEDGEKLGSITDIQNFGSADVFYISKTSGKEVLFSNVEGVIIEVTAEKVILNRKKFEEVSV